MNKNTTAPSKDVCCHTCGWMCEKWVGDEGRFTRVPKSSCGKYTFISNIGFARFMLRNNNMIVSCV